MSDDHEDATDGHDERDDHGVSPTVDRAHSGGTSDDPDEDRGDEVVAGDREVPPGEEKPPLSDLREEVERRRERRGEERIDEDVFEEMGGEELLDGEDVWEDLLEEPAGEVDTEGSAGVASNDQRPDEIVQGEGASAVVAGDEETAADQVAFAEPVEETDAAHVHVISNRVCHSCPYFGDPPELHCTHDGTEIRRVVDMDHYEVENCPMVREP